MKQGIILLLGILILGCRNTDDNLENIHCESKVDLGEFLLSEESLAEGLIYDSYDKVIFKSDRGDTLKFRVEKLDSIKFIDQIVKYSCDLDTSRKIYGEYITNAAFLSLEKLESTVHTKIESIGLRLLSRLNGDDPELGLNGDFIDFTLQTEIFNGSSFEGVLSAPINQRNYPLELEKYPWGNYHQQLEINGEVFTHVYSSLESSSVKILFTKEEGILMLEEADDLKWYFLGYE